MIRRKFVKNAGLGILSTAIHPGVGLYMDNRIPSVKRNTLTAANVNDHLRSLCKISESSVDRIVIGNPLTPVKKLGTAWMPYWETCREAIKKGVNVLVTHEPLFYGYFEIDDKPPTQAKEEYMEAINSKKKWILDHDLVIIRCHDVWDKIPDIGIPFGLGKALGFSNNDLIRSILFYNVYRVEPAPAIKIAKRIAAALKPANQPGVAFYGDENYLVKSVGVGTGCGCDPIKFSSMKPDLFIAIDDSIRTWVQPMFSKDTGRPLVVINHGTSEEFGIRLLNEYLKTTYPEYDIIHFDQGCTYGWVTI